MIFRVLADFWASVSLSNAKLGMSPALPIHSTGLESWPRKWGILKRLPRLTESARLRRQVGDKRGLCATLNNLANVARYSGQLPRGLALYEDVITGYRKLDAPLEHAVQSGPHLSRSRRARSGLGRPRGGACRGQRLGDTVNEAMAIVTLGAVAIDTGNPVRGKSYSHTAASLYRTMERTALSGRRCSMKA